MECFWTNLLAILIAVIIFGIAYLKWTFKYWNTKGIPTKTPSLPFGNDKNPLKRTKHFMHNLQEFYNEMKTQGHKHGGFYLVNLPVYVPIDPEHVKNVMVKDFQYFTERGFFYNEKYDPITAHLFAVGGQKWRKLRTKLTPTFTSGKMKMMFSMLIACGQPMLEYVDAFEAKKSPVNIKQVLSFFTTDIIGTCAFGLDCNSFKDPNSKFARMGNDVFNLSSFREAKAIFCLNFPSFARYVGMSILPKHLSDFYMNIVRETVEFREKNNYSRKDFMQLLLELKNAQEDNLTLEEIAAQAFVFFLAGFETSSTTLTFCFLELAKYPEIQEKVREEMNRVLECHERKITYDSIMDMKYMTQVVEETLRKYPPLPFVSRQSVNKYNIPDTDIILDNKTTVFIPIYSIHHDPEYYPDPETFDPERFSEENKQERQQYTYLPFGEGPRICIGLRFGMMQVKVGLTLLLQKYKFTLNDTTKYPVTFDPYSFTLSSKDPICLDIEKLSHKQLPDC